MIINNNHFFFACFFPLCKYLKKKSQKQQQHYNDISCSRGESNSKWYSGGDSIIATHHANRWTGGATICCSGSARSCHTRTSDRRTSTASTFGCCPIESRPASSISDTHCTSCRFTTATAISTGTTTDDGRIASCSLSCNILMSKFARDFPPTEMQCDLSFFFQSIFLYICPILCTSNTFTHHIRILSIKKIN